MMTVMCAITAERRVTGINTGHMHTQKELFTPGNQRQVRSKHSRWHAKEGKCSFRGRNSPQVTEKNMEVPRGALDWTTTEFWIFGMGPTAPTQATRPVAHARTLRSNGPEKVYS